MTAESSGSFEQDIRGGTRFEFGKNWRRFLATVSDERIRASEVSLADFLRLPSLVGMNFLDIGCGSGLSSLAAQRLGAQVTSFDFDPQSVTATNLLKTRFGEGDESWCVLTGSALDAKFMDGLGEFDIVYSWGVLHHTGDMVTGLDLAARRVRPGGRLFLAIYNDQGRMSRVWRQIKRLYCSLPRPLKPLLVLICFTRLWGPTLIRDTLRLAPLKTWRGYRTSRGMSAWHDVVDWVGGYPFEVATPEQIFDHYRQRGFTLDALKTCAGGIGCNEFVFIRRT